jgi:hypothetical protein
VRVLAAFLMRDRAQSVLGIVGLTVLSWLIAPLSLFAVAAITLLTLRNGAGYGASSALIAALAIALIGALFFKLPWQATAATVMLWLPAWLASIVLRETGQLALALVAVAGIGVLTVIALYSVYDDPASMWLAALRGRLEPLLSDSAGGAMADGEKLWKELSVFAPFLPGIVVGGAVMTVTASLLIGRWWQAILYNPGGFSKEFLRLRIPQTVGYFSAILLVCPWLLGSDWAQFAANLTGPLWTVFLLSGFSVLHNLFSGGGASNFWLMGIYAATVFISPLLLVIMLIGFTDIWLDWRKRISGA